MNDPTIGREDPPYDGAYEAAIRAARRLAEVEALSGIGSWEWDITTDELSWSEQLCRVYGVEPHPRPITYEDFIDRVHPDDRDAVRATVEEAFASHGSFETEHRAVHPDGTVHTIFGRGHVLVDDSGRPTRMLGSGQDVTGVRAEEEVRAAEERRRAAGQARDDAVALIAHDLRSPLAVVVGYIQLLQRQAANGVVDAAKLLPYLDRVDGAARQMTAFLDDLLSDAAVDEGADLLELSEVDLVPALEEIIEHHDAISAQHAVVGHLPSPPVVAAVNMPKLERALHNLLLNAIKYSPNGGTVILGLAVEGDEVRITVADEGIGIPVEDQPLVFDRFHRGGNVAEMTTGLGLGLISVKRAVDAHRGTVELTSEEGVGSTFTIRLPRQR